MKAIIISASILFSSIGISQISDSVAIGAGYTNEAYYSLETGEVLNIDNNDWDLGFDLSGFGATVKLNRRNSTMFVYPNSTADWATLDTTGLTDWDSYTDLYEYWSQGAFNNCADDSNPSDLGWGLYNTITHFIEGNRLFVVKLNTGEYKKLFIELLASGTYTFKYSNLDNTDEVSETIAKADYDGKNFVYYSMENEEIIDREPHRDTWDIVFTNVVLELGLGHFTGITTVLHNNPITVSEISDLPSDEATYGDFEEQINTIGYNWKTFDLGTFSYLIEDSLTYFIATEDGYGDVWKLVFTGFNGSVDGKTYFTKEKVEFATISKESISEPKIYPNPANETVTITTDQETIQFVMLINMAGQIVYNHSFTNQDESITIPVNDIQEGVYLLHLLNNANEPNIIKLIIKH